MRNARSLNSTVAGHRPPGAPARETQALGVIAQRWREELAHVSTETDVEALALYVDEVTKLAVAMSDLGGLASRTRTPTL